MGISTHILDTTAGRPAAGVAVSLARAADAGQWTMLDRGATDADGRCRFRLPNELAPGTYAVRFETGAYYAAQKVAGLYPWVEIAFQVAPGEPHYHIPLLLTANGYTTYRGS